VILNAATIATHPAMIFRGGYVLNADQHVEKSVDVRRDSNAQALARRDNVAMGPAQPPLFRADTGFELRESELNYFTATFGGH
jgi:hypothetical protein